MWCEFIFPVGMACLDVYIYISIKMDESAQRSEASAGETVL